MKLRNLLALLAVLTSAAHGLALARDVPAHIARAFADSSRPDAERALDVARKPAALLAFTGVSKGDKVVDLMPGGGYFSRLFSSAVGEAGKVIALQPLEMDKAAPEGLPKLHALAKSPGHANVSVVLESINALALPETVDLVWTSMNYHDLHVPFMRVADIAHVNDAIFAMLKPGGLFVVMDHAAAPSTGASQSDALHRIDPQAARKEILAAGFEFVDESHVLRTPGDAHALPSFDASMRGKTDRFVYRFRKPLPKELRK